jgi:hypothetical protein
MSNYFESIHHIAPKSLQQLLQNKLSEFHLAEHIHVLSETRLIGDSERPFLLQIDDYDIRLNFLEMSAKQPTLEANKLYDFKKILEDNPSTIALIIVWMMDDLPAVPFSTTRIQHLIQYPAHLTKLIQTAKPLITVIKTLIARQMKACELNLEPRNSENHEFTDMRRLFEQAIDSAIETQQKRSYRYAERQLAAHEFPVDEETEFILSILEQALNGENAHELVPNLVAI